MVPSRAIPHAAPSGNLLGTSLKRLLSETVTPPAKRTRSMPMETRRPAPLQSSNTAPTGALAGAKPASAGPGQDSFSLPYLFHGHHGRHLEPFIVGHSSEVQPYFDKLRIARGVQWELLRGIKSRRWTWKDVKAKLPDLKGVNATTGPKVREIMLGKSLRTGASHEPSLSLWEELDREVKATVENKSRGLGLMGEFEGVPDYHGGNIQCTIRLLYTGDETEPEVRLEPLQNTRSTHIARELGSLSVIALRDDKDGAVVRKWATRKFILCGRTYVALPPKSGKVYLIETDENYDREPQAWCGDQHRISYDEYIRRNNPMDLNANQPFAKYLTRLNLYLSTSIPVLEFSPDNIRFIDDEFADGWSKEQKPPTETIMTDGSGFINRAAAQKIRSRFKYERLPVAYQGRIAGSKGLWILHPSDESTEPTIWIRASQRKIVFRRLLRQHRIFDLLAVSSPSSSPTLSAQAIIILANNGVPAHVFCALQEEGLKDLIRPLMDWKRPYANAPLWDAINNAGNVTRSRLQRMAAGASRALGFEKRSYTESDNLDDTEKDADLSDLPHTGRNAFSGEPLTVPEAAMDLVQAGFDPLVSPILSQKIHTVIKTTMEVFLTRYRIPLVSSFEAYIIPDPTGLLQEGQVFFKSSKDPDTPLREQVVVGRYPMRESSDMQKVTAVDIPALWEYLDVLVTPIHGSRSLASLLAGGDTDGDDAIIIRDLAIVGPFRNQAVVPVPEKFLAENFERQVQTVVDFGEALQRMGNSPAQCAFQQEVLAGLVDDKIGIYSIFHDCAVYRYGLDHAKTRRMAHMTSTLLDASKTGLRLLKKVEEADELEFGKPAQRARCFDVKNGHKKKRKLGPFVLDSLLAAGEATKDTLLVEFETDVASHLTSDSPIDADLTAPYKRLKAFANADADGNILAADIRIIENRIEELLPRYLSEVGKYMKNDPQEPWELAKNNRKKRSAKMTDNPMLPIMRDFREPLVGLKYLHITSNVDEIKASCAFTRNARFGLSMAFRDICQIKTNAEMKRGHRVAFLDDAKDLGGAARRLFKHLGE
ncbi:RNA dependent RNA polymerase-domain-containing protein [Mycena galericulata]|nr:RNA dependent RNA polymerase-domain-containing protein [Mycena galericulata]